MIQSGANASTVNLEGFNPRDVAERENNSKMTKILSKTLAADIK